MSSRRWRSDGSWCGYPERRAYRSSEALRTQIAVRGGDDSQIDLHRPRGADRQDLALLEHAQEGRLRRRLEIADLVQEQRPLVGGADEADLVAVGARERAAHVAEELALDERRRQGSAVDGHERARAHRESVDRPGEDLLASTALAEQEHRHVGGRDPRTSEPSASSIAGTSVTSPRTCRAIPSLSTSVGAPCVGRPLLSTKKELPSSTSERSSRSAPSVRWPSTRDPFVDPRSTTRNPAPVRSKRACFEDMRESGTIDDHPDLAALGHALDRLLGASTDSDLVHVSQRDAGASRERPRALEHEEQVRLGRRVRLVVAPGASGSVFSYAIAPRS